jgi:UDP-3-O-acyl-N-acetylglucosamine deacetylase
MSDKPYGKVISGREDVVAHAYDKWEAQGVDQTWTNPTPAGKRPFSDKLTTLGKAVSVTGPGTFFGKAERTLRFEPSELKGWWFNRTDIPTAMPIKVSVNDVWTTARNIVLSSGSPHNYMRMVEHIIALKAGLGIDNVMIHMDSGDPPLFDNSSTDLVKAFDDAGTVEQEKDAIWLGVKQPVTVTSASGGFLTFLPPENGEQKLSMDCAVDFKSAIGRQRIQFDVTPESFRHGATARTNTTLLMMLYCKTIGKIFADVRNLGYTNKNILIAGPRNYFNQPLLIHEGKSLEAVWHRAVLDLLAAVALIDKGRFAGKIISYKAGHALDCEMIKQLYQRSLLERI